MTGYLYRRNLWKNERMEKKILFLDMDGTTLNHRHEISPENLMALEKAIRAGHEVVVCTGRMPNSADFLLKHYGLDQIGCRYVIAINGGMVLDCATKEVFCERTVPLSVIEKLIDAAHEQGIYFQTYTGEFVLTEQDDENLKHYLNKTGMNCRLVPDMKTALKTNPYKALAISLCGREVLETFREYVRPWAGPDVEMEFSCPEYLEFLPKGVHKGVAVEQLCRLLNIPLTNAIAAGDEFNDISMIRAAGIGCAVANAIEPVKAAADYVTENDNDHSAIAEIVERFMLN